MEVSLNHINFFRMKQLPIFKKAKTQMNAFSLLISILSIIEIFIESSLFAKIVT